MLTVQIIALNVLLYCTGDGVTADDIGVSTAGTNVIEEDLPLIGQNYFEIFLFNK